MIKRNSEFIRETRNSMRGGEGDVKFEHIWEQGTELKSKTRLFSKIILEKGCSIGTHAHENEEEVFYVFQGEAMVDDNGVKSILKTGDSIVTGNGASHSIACHGDETCIVLAVIMCY